MQYATSMQKYLNVAEIWDNLLKYGTIWDTFWKYGIYGKPAIDTRVHECAYQSMNSVRGERLTDDLQLRSWIDQTPEMGLTCLVSVIPLSMRTPRSRTQSPGRRSTSDTLIPVLLQWCRRRLKPNHISSVFEGLRRSQLELIQALMLSMHVDIHVARRAASCCTACPLTCKSSAKSCT